MAEVQVHNIRCIFQHTARQIAYFTVIKAHKDFCIGVRECLEPCYVVKAECSNQVSWMFWPTGYYVFEALLGAVQAESCVVFQPLTVTPGAQVLGVTISILEQGQAPQLAKKEEIYLRKYLITVVEKSCRGYIKKGINLLTCGFILMLRIIVPSNQL